jgi:hypothetical protein
MPVSVRPDEADGTQRPYAPIRSDTIVIPYPPPPPAPMIAVYLIPTIYSVERSVCPCVMKDDEIDSPVRRETVKIRP